MTGWTLFFTVLGVTTFSYYLCRFLFWFDNPDSKW